MSCPCSVGISLDGEAVSKQHTIHKTPKISHIFQPDHKKNTNFHKICWKLDLMLHDLSQFFNLLVN